jgi:hypothetical protein
MAANCWDLNPSLTITSGVIGHAGGEADELAFGWDWSMKAPLRNACIQAAAMQRISKVTYPA